MKADKINNPTLQQKTKKQIKGKRGRPKIYSNTKELIRINSER